MQPSELIVKLTRILPAAQSQKVIPALQQDPLVWVTLQDEGFLNRAIRFAGDRSERWTPAYLALVAITGRENPDISRSDLIDQAVACSKGCQRLLDEARQIVRQPKSLAEAGKLALAIRQRLMNMDAGKNLLQEIVSAPVENERPVFLAWQTVIAILAGISEDPSAIFRLLLPKRSSSLAMQWISHAMLTNQVEESKSVEMLSSLLTGLPPIQQLNWLRHFSILGQSGLVEACAQSLLAKISINASHYLNKTNLDTTDLETVIVRSLELQRMAGLYRFSNQPANARAMLQRSELILQHWLAGLGIQEADLASSEGMDQAAMMALGQAMTTGGGANGIQTEILLSVPDRQQSEQLVENFSDQTTNPFSQVFLANRIAHAGEIELGREMASRAVEIWLQQANLQVLPVNIQFAFHWYPANVVQALMDLRLPEQALAVAEKLIEMVPSDPNFYSLLVEINNQLGDSEKALEYAQMAAIADPMDASKHFCLANQWARLGRWSEAYEEQYQVIILHQPPQAEDWVTLGRYAIAMKEWASAMVACDRALALVPDYGRALAYKGLISIEQGDLEEAGKLLSRATLLAPEEAEGWLQLARLYESQGNQLRALETLRAAVLAIPSSADINFALAKASLAEGLVSDALPYLRKAAQLNPESAAIAVNLGETLTQLGYLDEANRVFAISRSKWPQNPHLAFAQANAALLNNNNQLALTALEVALNDPEPHFEWLLLYARVILDDLANNDSKSSAAQAWVSRAEKAVQKALIERADSFEAMLLLAEVSLKKGDDLGAYQIYKSLMDKPEFDTSEYRWRVQAGLGQAALSLNEIDSALASLQEATREKPENLYLQHLLAEAYAASQLTQQAFTTAQDALQLAPDHLANLAWYAEFMASMSEPMEAIQALRTATQLDQDNPIHWMDLAELYCQVGDEKAEKFCLEQLLGLPALDSEILHRAARAYSRLAEPQDVYRCLTSIAEPGAGTQAEIAYIAYCIGRWEEGLKAAQAIAKEYPHDSAVYLIESDLLIALNRQDAALACLEHALRLSENSSKKTGAASWLVEANRNGLVPEAWINSLQVAEAVHDRLAKLFWKMGDLNSSEIHASQAMDLCPGGYAIRLQAAELSEALLLYDRLREILDNLRLLPEESFPASQVERSSLAQLAAMRAELVLDERNIEEAGKWIEYGLSLDVKQARLCAVQARLLAMKCKWQEAELLYAEVPATSAVWYARTALDLYQWDKGLSCLEAITDQQPSNLQAQLWFARGLVTAARLQKYGSAYGLIQRLPGEHVVTAKAQDQFERAIKAAMRSNHQLAGRWQAMGRVIYQPGTQSIRSLAALLPGDLEAAVLISALHEIGNLAGADQVAEQYLESAEVQTQAAVCYLARDPRRSLEFAKKAWSLQPEHPMCNALLAIALRSNSEFIEGLDRLEQALEAWPNEPQWHIWASEMAEVLGLSKKVVDHWDLTMDSMPVNKTYAAAAAKAYLAHQQEQKAIAVLEVASSEEPDRADLWHLLGQAHYQAGHIKQALSCAERAFRCQPDAVEPALLCGEIHLKLGHADDALEWSLKAVSINPRNPDVILFHARVLEQRNNLADALSILDGAIADNVVTEELLLERARLVHKSRGPLAALPLLREASQAYPGQLAILATLAKIELESGNEQNAEEMACRVLRLDSNQPEMNLILGKIMRRRGQLDQAIFYLSEAIRQQPNLVESYSELGQAHLDRREPDHALQVFQMAIKANPQDYQPYYQAGLILRENKDYRGAETMLRRAAELSPNDINIRRQLGAVITLNLIHSSQEASTLNEIHHA